MRSCPSFFLYFMRKKFFTHRPTNFFGGLLEQNCVTTSNEVVLLLLLGQHTFVQRIKFHKKTNKIVKHLIQLSFAIKGTPARLIPLAFSLFYMMSCMNWFGFQGKFTWIEHIRKKKIQKENENNCFQGHDKEMIFQENHNLLTLIKSIYLKNWTYNVVDAHILRNSSLLVTDGYP